MSRRQEEPWSGLDKLAKAQLAWAFVLLCLAGIAAMVGPLGGLFTADLLVFAAYVSAAVSAWLACFRRCL